MADIFVSYASEDRDRVRPLVDVLAEAGWSVWWDRELIAGPSFDEIIERELDAARCVVVAWSEHSVASRWCRNEATEGLERGVLVPLRLDDARAPLAFRGAQTADLCFWPAKRGELDELLAGIADCLGQPRASGDASPPARTRPRKFHRAVSIGAGGAALALAAAAGWMVFAQREPVPQSDAVPPTTIAVTPFEPTDTDGSKGPAFGRALTASLRTELVNAPGITVVANAGVQTGGTAAGAAAEAGYLLSGSWHRSDSDINVTVNLRTRVSGDLLWSQTYQHPAAEVLDPDLGVAPAIAYGARTEVGLHQQRLGWQSLNPDPWALDMNMRAYAQYYQLVNGYGGSVSLIQSMYSKAIEIDPDFIGPLLPSLAMLGPSWSPTLSHDVRRQRSSALIERCYAIARALPAGADVFMTNECRMQDVQHRLWTDFDYATTHALLDEVVAFNPENFIVYWVRAFALVMESRWQAATEALRSAEQTDHRGERLLFELSACQMYWWLDAPVDARRMCDEGIRHAASPRMRALFLRMAARLDIHARDPERARGSVERAWRLAGTDDPRRFADLYLQLGQRERAHQLYPDLASTGWPIVRIGGTLVAAEPIEVMLAFGDEAAAIDYLARAVEQRAISALLAARSPRVRGALADHPDFQHIEQLLDQLETTGILSETTATSATNGGRSPSAR